MRANGNPEPRPPATTAVDDQFVSVSEAARALGMSRPTVHARVASGKLEQRTVAGRPVITRSSLDRLLAEQERARAHQAVA